MLDHFDTRAWADHHHQFDQWVASATSALRRTLGRAERVPPQLLAAAFALGATLITLGGSAA